MNKLILISIVLVIVLLGFYLYQQSQVRDGLTKIRVGDAGVKVIVRDTVEGRRQGLSGFERLEDDQGMLFVFPVLGKYSFWMKGMKLDLDFVWIKDNKVVEITENVSAPREGGVPVKVQPSQAVNKVLEVSSGFVKRNKIVVGDEVKY